MSLVQNVQNGVSDQDLNPNSGFVRMPGRRRIIRSDIRHPAKKNRSGPSLNPTYQFLAGLALAHFVLGVELVAVLLEVLLDVLDLVLGQQGGRPGTPGQLEKMAVLFKKTVLFSTKLRK